LAGRHNVFMPKKPPSSGYQLKIALTGISPPIWRCIEVPGSIRMCCLHSAFQVVMGWTDNHLHQFERDGQNWGVPEWDELEEFDLIDEGKTRLAEVLKTEGESMVYRYDFGDDWHHMILLEKILPGDNPLNRPVCLAGERRCPPEDVGGVHGYQEFLEIIFDSAHKEYKQYVRWAGGHFIDEFDLKAANVKLSGMRWPVRHRY